MTGSSALMQLEPMVHSEATCTLADPVPVRTGIWSGRCSSQRAPDAGDLFAFRAWLMSERGFEPPEDWDLFTIDIDALTVISVDGGQLVVDRWSMTDGRQTTRRT